VNLLQRLELGAVVSDDAPVAHIEEKGYRRR
jgi:hypothetical protein